MNDSLVKNLWNRLGGSAFLNLRQYLAITPYALIFATLVGIGTRGNLPLSIELFGQFTSFGACWVTFLIASFYIFPNRAKKPVHPILVLGFSVGVGLVNFATYVAAVAIAGHANDIEQNLILLFANSVIFGVISVTALAAYRVISAQFLTERELLAAESLSYEIQRRKETYLAPLIQKLRQAIDSQKASISSEPSDLATKIQDLVNTDVRPLSRQLWAEKVQLTPQYSFRNLTRILLKDRPFIPAFAVLPGLIPTLATALLSLQLPATLFHLAIDALMLSTLYFFANRISRRSSKLAVVIYVATSLLSPGLVVMVNTAITPSFYGNLPFAYALLGIWLLIVNFVLSFVAASLRTRSEILTQIKEFEVSKGPKDIASALDSIANREIANLLHSKVQNHLLAFSKNLSLSDISPERYAELISLLELELSESIGTSSPDFMSLQEACSNLQRSWEGVLDLSFSGLETARELPLLLLPALIEEAVSNAVRHGKAKKMEIELLTRDGNLHLIATDDGFGPLRGKPSLGSSLFDLVSKGDWSLTSINSGGSRLQINLAELKEPGLP